MAPLLTIVSSLHTDRLLLEIQAFIAASRELPLSYEPVGLATDDGAGFNVDAEETIVGVGEAAFARAKAALTGWRQFELGPVEVFPTPAGIAPGTVVAVLDRHLGFWSLNGCRVVYSIAGDDPRELGLGGTAR